MGRSRRVIGGAVAATLLLVAVVATLAYFGAGLRAYVIETPSMGTYAPVGTLVLAKPADGSISEGDTILFTPPGSTKVYFHRVVEASPSGIFTAGDLTRERDPWTLTSSNVIGIEAGHVLNLGWLAKIGPLLLLGSLLLWVYVRFFTVRFWRVPATFFGASIILSLANYVVHPLVQGTLLDKSVQGGIATIRFVNTGILPLEVVIGGHTHIVEQGALFVAHAKVAERGGYSLSALPHVDWWLALTFALAAAVPSVVGFTYLLRNRNSPENWYYVPYRREQLPEGTILNVSDQVVAGGRVYPRYVSMDYDPDEEAASWRKLLRDYTLTTDSR